MNFNECFLQLKHDTENILDIYYEEKNNLQLFDNFFYMNQYDFEKKNLRLIYYQFAYLFIFCYFLKRLSFRTSKEI
jgi:hypothetical protein